jgi:glycosyltransferase involved in cell wall biosynthesis
MLIGGGEQLPHLEKEAEVWGVTNRVIFTGWRDNARELVQGSDLFVFPSLWEGMSESLLEATTCKVPCLVSDIPENTEVIRNPEQHFNPSKQDELILKLNRCIEEKVYYEELLRQTEADGARFKFDWEKELIGKISKIIAGKV